MTFWFWVNTNSTFIRFGQQVMSSHFHLIASSRVKNFIGYLEFKRSLFLFLLLWKFFFCFVFPCLLFLLFFPHLQWETCKIFWSVQRQERYALIDHVIVNGQFIGYFRQVRFEICRINLFYFCTADNVYIEPTILISSLHHDPPLAANYFGVMITPRFTM